MPEFGWVLAGFVGGFGVALLLFGAGYRLLEYGVAIDLMRRLGAFKGWWRRLLPPRKGR